MTTRTCIRCGRLVTNASYCAEHNPAKHYHTPTYRQLQKEVKRRYTGLPCPVCGEAMLPPLRTPSIDHIVPLLQGGDSSPSNLRCICLACNAAKRGRGAGRRR
jgi:5-methylcytosine-specific restriction endonuclease McrA